MNFISFARFSFHSVDVAGFAKSVRALGGWGLDLIQAISIIRKKKMLIFYFILRFCVEHVISFSCSCFDASYHVVLIEIFEEGAKEKAQARTSCRLRIEK